MESSFAFFIFFSLVLFATAIEARKDPGEYWEGIMKDQQMPEAIQGLVHKDSVLPLSNKRSDCHEKEQSTFVKDAKLTEEESFVKDFEPRPNVSVYHDDAEDKSFVKDFEPRPNVSVYHDDAEDKSFVKDFEPRPNVSVYHDDAEDKSFVKDFEPRPNVSVYRE